MSKNSHLTLYITTQGFNPEDFKIMAKGKLKIPLTLPLKLGDHHAYEVNGVDGTILRENGGISKKKYKNDPNLEEVRANGSEFGGASTMASSIRRALITIEHLKDFNYFNKLRTISEKIRSFDESNLQGERSVTLTKYKSMLQGFDLNDKNIFAFVVKSLPSCVISREDLTATINFTDLYPKITLMNPWELPVYRFYFCMAVVKDKRYTKYGYQDENDAIRFSNACQKTGWLSYQENFSASELKLKFNDNSIIDESCTLVVAVGIEFGKLMSFTEVKTQNAGCAKIVGVG